MARVLTKDHFMIGCVQQCSTANTAPARFWWKQQWPRPMASVALLFGRLLEKDGILQYRNRHLVVRMTTLEEVMEIYDCRIVLEGVAAEWAARARTDNDLVLLELALNDMKLALGPSPSELASVNHAFHDQLWRSSHNSTLVDLLTRLEVHTRRYPEPTVNQPGRWEEAIAEHSAIIEAIRRHDPETAKRLSREHMTAARDLRLRMVRATRAADR